MRRVIEPEIMDDETQALAYAGADFSEPNSLFVRLFEQRFADWQGQGEVLDLGCGPADIAFRMARRFPGCHVNAVDGSTAMLACAEMARSKWGADGERVRLVEAVLPALEIPRASQASVISNSLLHHLHDPAVLWQSVRDYAMRGAPVLIMDLVRPASVADAAAIVSKYAGDEPEVLRRDFYNSLRAAFEVREVEAQLREAGLTGLRVEAVSDRHLCVSGLAAPGDA